MSNLNTSMILADEASAACNAKTYNAATSSKKRSKDGATMTPHSGKNESKLTPSVGKKRRPHIEMNTEGFDWIQSELKFSEGQAIVNDLSRSNPKKLLTILTTPSTFLSSE